MPIDLPAEPMRSSRPFSLTGRMVLLSMLGFFAVVVAVNAVMMTAAIRTMPGVDVRSAYETSQTFNGEIARMHAQTKRGWQAQAQVLRKEGGAAVTLTLRDHAGVPVTDLLVEARLQHPASRQNDREATLTEISPGLYAASLADVSRGAWTLAVEARRDGAPIFISRSRLLLTE